MKAKDLTQADVGKWVTLRAKIVSILDGRVYTQLEGDTNAYLCHEAMLNPDTILEFTDPPAPVQEVGDVFKNGYNLKEWTIVSIVENLCLLKTDDDHVSQFYPLDRRRWTLVRKGAKS